MADYDNPYGGNPYLQMPQQEAPDWRMVLANLATGLGTGISQGAASGQGWAAGLAPGIMMGNQLTGQQQQNAQQQAMKRWQLGMMAQEFGDKRAERARKERAIQEAANEFAPGLRAPQPSPVQMGPGSYETKVAGLEGGSKNGGMIFNELGSGAFGPYQFMPATWADVAAKNPNLGLPADMTKATREQHDAAHSAFKAGNAQALQAAGFQPTPENLYLAHRFGAGGAVNLLRSDPSKSLAEVLPVDWQRQNPDMRGQTVGGFQRLAGERMRGVGVPYEAPQNAQPTQYALQPNALPSFDDPTLSLAPRPNSRFMPGVLPNSDVAPNVTAPVMPQPQATMTTAQFTPPPAAPAPASDAPPKMTLPPKPELPDADAARIGRLLRAGAITREQARSEADKITGDLWTAQKDQVRARHTADLEVWKQRQEGGRFERGKTAEQERHERDLAERKTAREVPSGYRKRDDGLLEPIPGGPEDPEVIRQKSDVRRTASEKAIPQTVVRGMQDNLDALKQIDRTMAELKQKPGSVGGVGSTAAAMIPGVGNLQNRWGDPEGTKLRALIADIGSLKIHDRSGAAVTASEFPRLRPFIPTISDDAKTVETKLQNFRAVYEQTLLDTTGYYNAENGFKPHGPTESYLSGGQSAKPPESTRATAPPAAVKHLQMNPKLRDEFDAKYGQGAAAKVLGK